MALIKCKECGKEYSSNADACPKCGNPTKNKEETKETKEPTINVNIKEKVKRKWHTGKLIIAIISMVLFLIVSLQSCAAGLGNAISDNGSHSGTSGFLCALFLLIGGIITLTTRTAKGNGGIITAIVFYWLGALLTAGTGETYPDLPVWGSISFAFGLVNLGGLILEKPNFKDPKKQRIVLIAVIILSIIGFFISVDSENTESSKTKPSTNGVTTNTNSESSSNQKDDSTNKNMYGLSSNFIFDDLEITIGNEIAYEKINNRYSENHGKTVVKVPIAIKNMKGETHSLNTFYYKAFGSQGTQIDNAGYYFDDSVEEAGELRNNASYTKYFYLLYDGNGTYAIEFDDWSEKITVEFAVNN